MREGLLLEENNMLSGPEVISSCIDERSFGGVLDRAKTPKSTKLRRAVRSAPCLWSKVTRWHVVRAHSAW